MNKNVGLAVKAAGAIPGEIIVESILTDLYDLAKHAAGDRLKVWHVKKSARKLHRHVHKIRLVKTLWQVDKAVDLKQFYCDSHLMLGGKRTVVRTLKDLEGRKRVLISGIAGQGKSILLRYMCSNALMAGECLPVFIELRRVHTEDSLIDHIQQFLEIVGIDSLSDDVLKALLASGKVVLFLDGFDEVSETDKPKIVHEIEHLALTFDDLRLIITSRPESGIEVSPLFEVVRLSDLIRDEYKTLIRKLTDDTAFAENLIRQIEAHKSKLEDLLCTPLLVTLLVMSYKSFQELPEQLSEFYDSIFQVLLQRHDGAKPGFKRPRRCSFNDNQYRSVFEGLCYESKRKVRKSVFGYEDVCSFAKAALEKYHLRDDPDKYIEDIVKVTCLILREGKDYRFIHRSVQEYYASAFIRHRSEPVAKRFYEQMITHGSYGMWRQELMFLSEIDRYRFNKYYYLPYLCNIMGCTPVTIPYEPPEANLERARGLFGEMKLGFRERPGIPLTCMSMTVTPYVSHIYVDKLFKLDFNAVTKAVDERCIIPQENPVRSPRQLDEDERFFVTIAQILDAGLLHGDLVDLAQVLLTDTHSAAVRAVELIKAEESVDINLSIDME